MAGNLVQPFNTSANGSVVNPLLPTQQATFRFWAKPVYTAADGTLWSPGFDGPTFSFNEWDYIKIPNAFFGPSAGGPDPPDRTPGICHVSPRKEYAVDKKKPIGADGARVTYHGIDAAEFDIEIKIWTPEQLRQLNLLWANLFPPAGKGTPAAFDVSHPALNETHGIKSLQFMAGAGPDVQQDRSGIFRIHAIEFLPPPPTKKSATKTQVKSVANRLDAGATPTPGQNPNNLAPR